MKKFCEKILWLEYGMVKDFGTVEEVIPKYEIFKTVQKNVEERKGNLQKRGDGASAKSLDTKMKKYEKSITKMKYL